MTDLQAHIREAPGKLLAERERILREVEIQHVIQETLEKLGPCKYTDTGEQFWLANAKRTLRKWWLLRWDENPLRADAKTYALMMAYAEMTSDHLGADAVKDGELTYRGVKVVCIEDEADTPTIIEKAE